MVHVVAHVESQVLTKHSTPEGSINQVQQCTNSSRTSSAVRAHIAGMISQTPQQPGAEDHGADHTSEDAPTASPSSMTTRRLNPKVAPPLTPSSEMVRCDSLRGPPLARGSSNDTVSDGHACQITACDSSPDHSPVDTIRAAMCNIRGEVVHQESEARSNLWRAKCRGDQ